MGETPASIVPRPPSWGGYVLHTESVELWVSRPARIHDRAVWTRASESGSSTTTNWNVVRLQP
jgi:pyridoxamine 5'-phosphate oxidase